MEEIIEQPQTTLRETLEANVEAAEQGTLPTPEERSRDDAGRFAAKPKEAPVAPETPTPVEQWNGPSTWKKEYRPLYDKLNSGQALTAQEAKKLAEYTNQRENDFKTGVSTYRTEALQAKELQEAVTPFLPELQQAGLNPAQWIKSLGQAHYALYKGSPELKLQVLQQLVRQFNIPVGMLGQQAPQAMQQWGLSQALQPLQQQVQSVSQWINQYEQQKLASEVEAFKNQKDEHGNPAHPHFEAVRETMAQLLERGLAPDLQSAHDKAIWMNEGTREALMKPQMQVANRQQAVARAKAAAVSPRSATPSGTGTSNAKDRRALLAEQFGEAEGRV